MYKKLTEAADLLKDKGFTGVDAIVIFADAADQLPVRDCLKRVSFQNLSILPEWMQGEFCMTEVNNKKVLVVIDYSKQSDECKLSDLVIPVRLLFLLGVKRIFLLNKSIAVNETLEAGNIVLLDDHISFLESSPLSGPNIDELGPRFPDMSAPYDTLLNEKLVQNDSRKIISMRKGIYAAYPQNAFNSPDMKLSGADCAGGTLVPAVIVAVHMGMQTAALCMVTGKLSDKVDFNPAYRLARATIAN